MKKLIHIVSSQTLLLGLLLCSQVQAQTIIPGKFQKTQVCYNKAGKAVCEKFNAPTVTPDFGPVKYLQGSPLDPSRSVFALPTYPLALWHWWLFDQQLKRAQRQYADCVGRIRLSQELLGEYPLIDDQKLSPAWPGIKNIREYEVPFNPINPVTLEFARANADAAIFSVNLTVYHIGLCENTALSYKTRLQQKLQKGK